MRNGMRRRELSGVSAHISVRPVFGRALSSFRPQGSPDLGCSQHDVTFFFFPFWLPNGRAVTFRPFSLSHVVVGRHIDPTLFIFCIFGFL